MRDGLARHVVGEAGRAAGRRGKRADGAEDRLSDRQAADARRRPDEVRSRVVVVAGDGARAFVRDTGTGAGRARSQR
ncbi:hypothetical protein, partial [Methylobacterium sp. WL103]|uniref:hypothetical protein n=1 Tax=Methylobacterium sp. WL103 TaxID=2603891 RepID=UPI001AEE234E